MNIWRIISHRTYPKETISIMKQKNRICIGWSEIGDLNKLNINKFSDITKYIKNKNSERTNTNTGGPSLWRFYKEMQIGDYVIVNSRGGIRDCVFEVLGDYQFVYGEDVIFNYAHQREARLTEINAEELWEKSGEIVADGESQRWTLCKCKGNYETDKIIYKEGNTYSAISKSIERNQDARKKCLEFYKNKYECFICGININKTYGEIGKNYIHVHHIVDLSSFKGIHDVDPEKDLVPLCPNCHSMAHRRKPAILINELKELYTKNNYRK